MNATDLLHPLTQPRRNDTVGDAVVVSAQSDAAVLDILRRHGDHPSGFLAFNTGTCHYQPPGLDGSIAFRPAGRRHVVELFGPLATAGTRWRLINEFRALAAAQGRHLAAVQLRREDAELYADSGFVVNQLGTSYSIRLDDYGIKGHRFMRIRNKISRAVREGVTVHAFEGSALSRNGLQAELAAVDRDWLRGKRAHELAFMIGERGGRGQALRRLFIARHRGRAVAYATYSPCYGSRAGWLYDLTRRRPDAPAGTIELVFHTALCAFQAEGCRWLHLGLTPFVGLDDAHEIPGHTSRAARTIVRQIARRGQMIYPAASQVAFKLKWHPQHTEPEYVAFDSRVRLGAVWQLLRLTHAI